MNFSSANISAVFLVITADLPLFRHQRRQAHDFAAGFGAASPIKRQIKDAIPLLLQIIRNRWEGCDGIALNGIVK
jgi:hypothetical protein